LLYAVTSRALAGHGNALAAFGYNRDGQAGKHQVGLGLVCDEKGRPVSGAVWAGHPPAMTTLAAQSTKVARRLGGARVPCVGERGRSKGPQSEELGRAGCPSMTAVPTPQGERLLQANGRPLALFPAQGRAVAHEGTRDLVRHNPRRAEERAAVRCAKQRSREQGGAPQNADRAPPPRAQGAVARRAAPPNRTRLPIDAWRTGEAAGRPIA
jgi:hypothetical protein